ncbi:hypothetical protein QQ045_026334 [Rhodiola kirilowii]
MDTELTQTINDVGDVEMTIQEEVPEFEKEKSPAAAVGAQEDEPRVAKPAIQRRKIVPERILKAEKYPVKEIVSLLKEIVSLLKEVDLFNSVIMAKPFVEQVVKEVIANLSKGFGKIRDPDYGKLRIRGRTISIINDYYGITSSEEEAEEDIRLDKVVTVLTGDTRNDWRDTTIQASELTTKFACLYHIGIRNWISTSHRTTVFETDNKLFKGKHVLDVAEDVQVSSGKAVPDLPMQGTCSTVNVPEAMRLKMITYLEEELASTNQVAFHLVVRRKKITKMLVNLRYPEEKDEEDAESEN